MKHSFTSRILRGAIAALAVFFLASCQTAGRPHLAVPVYTHDLKIGDTVYPIKVSEVSRDKDGRITVTIESANEDLIPKDIDGDAIPWVSISYSGGYYDDFECNIADGKITYYFDTPLELEPEIILVSAPEDGYDLSKWKAFAATGQAIDLFGRADEGVDIYQLWKAGKIDVEITGLDATDFLMLKIARTSKSKNEDIIVKIDPGAWFGPHSGADPVPAFFDNREPHGYSAINAGFVTATEGYYAVPVGVGGGVQGMGAKEFYALKLLKATEMVLPRLFNRAFLPQPNSSGIVLASTGTDTPMPQFYPYTILIPVVCLDYEKGTPQTNDQFTPQPKRKDLIPLLQELKKQNAAPDVCQNAIWLFQGGREKSFAQLPPGEIIAYAKKWWEIDGKDMKLQGLDMKLQELAAVLCLEDFLDNENVRDKEKAAEWLYSEEGRPFILDAIIELLQKDKSVIQQQLWLQQQRLQQYLKYLEYLEQLQKYLKYLERRQKLFQP